jgi:hypothetical protein
MISLENQFERIYSFTGWCLASILQLVLITAKMPLCWTAK